MLSVLLIPLLTQALVIRENWCIGDSCRTNLRTYLRELNPRFQSEKVLNNEEDNIYLTTISQYQPSSNVEGLFVNVYTVGSGIIRVTNLTGHTGGGNFTINIRLSERDINDPLKCALINVDSIYINRECTFFIEYISQIPSGPAKFYIYMMVVRIPHVLEYDYHVNSSLIEERLDNCEFVNNLRYNVKLYTGEGCKEEITPRTVVNYMNHICIGVFGNDVITVLSYLEVGALWATYTRHGSAEQIIDMLGLAIIKSSLNETNAKGQLYVVIPIMHIERISINMVIASKRTRRMLSDELVCGELFLNKGIYINLPEILSFGEPDEEPFLPEEPEDAGSVVVSLITFLCLLVVIF